MFQIHCLYCQTPGQLEDYLFCLGILDFVSMAVGKPRFRKCFGWSLKKILDEPWMLNSWRGSWMNPKYLSFWRGSWMNPECLNLQSISSLVNALVQVEGLLLHVLFHVTPTWGSSYLLPLGAHHIYCHLRLIIFTATWGPLSCYCSWRGQVLDWHKYYQS